MLLAKILINSLRGKVYFATIKYIKFVLTKDFTYDRSKPRQNLLLRRRTDEY